MARGGAPAPALLAAVALGAAALNQLFWLMPLALMLGLPALWWGNAFIAGLAVVAFLVLAWVLQPRQPSPPHELRPDEAPQLFERVNALADALQAPRVHAIALDDELNAGALELNRGVSLRPVRRVLVLGRPLLAALDVPAAEAVIAHELGHFSRRHGRLGHWLYRTRQSWEALSQLEDGDAPVAASSPWERAAAGFANRFLPWFDRLSFAHMRRCEFEADALAAQVAGPVELARALVQLQRLQAPRALIGDTVRRRWMREHAEPPVDLLAREVAAWREAAQGVDAVQDTSGSGTHPPLAQRLAALGVVAPDGSWPSVVAADWLPEAVAQGTPADVAAALLRWHMGHRLLRELVPGPEATPARRLQLALTLGEPTQALAQVLGDSPLELLLRARVEIQAQRRDSARQLLEACRAHKTAERDVATAWLVADELGANAEERHRHGGWLRLVRARREAALEQLAADREQGKVDLAPLPATDGAALGGALQKHPAVREAWLFGQTAAAQGVSYQAAVLLLRVDAAATLELGLDEDSLAELAHELLAWVSPPGQLRLVLTRYTTEGLMPKLGAALAAKPATRLF
ncbi:M48 family metalloprotease [Roseateles sp. P5_E1]